MKEKLFKLLFPIHAEHLRQYQEVVPLQNRKIRELQEEIENIKSVPEPNLADLMREDMAILPHRYDPEGPFDPLKGLSSKEYEVRVHELNQVFHNRAFNELLESLTNAQFHYTMNTAVSDSQIYAGRFHIDGLALIKANLNRYHNIYEESNSPPDSYDQHEIINELN